MIDYDNVEYDDPHEMQKRTPYNPDELAEDALDGGNEGELHPSPEMLLIRMAIDKALFKDQRELWNMYAYDKLRPADIARKLKISKQAVGQRLKVIEGKIAAYCNEHWQVHKALKEGKLMKAKIAVARLIMHFLGRHPRLLMYRPFHKLMNYAFGIRALNGDYR